MGIDEVAGCRTPYRAFHVLRESHRKPALERSSSGPFIGSSSDIGSPPSISSASVVAGTASTVSPCHSQTVLSEGGRLAFRRSLRLLLRLLMPDEDAAEEQMPALLMPQGMRLNQGGGEVSARFSFSNLSSQSFGSFASGYGRD